MQLPRRVPWTSIAELDQVCAWIYEDENDLDSKILALNKLTAWKVITALPHAIESTLAFLVVFLDDSGPKKATFSLSLRQNYAAAVIRLVNGLVDPLQLGAYARSIASISHQLGLPLWLVELRHASTHEDLPSLELLREGARQSMTWLLHNYWLPTVNPYTAPIPQTTLRSIVLVLKEYKMLLKETIRDESLKNRNKLAISNVLKDVERWIAEAKVAANVSIGDLGWENVSANNQDTKERFALEKLSDEMLARGILVPLSKKKRTFPPDLFHPPGFSVQLWTPLLVHLQTAHPDFPSVLVNRILSCLLSEQEGTSTDSKNSSYHACLARWVKWIIDNWDRDDPDMEVSMRREVVVSLITALGPGTSLARKNAPSELLQVLCDGNEDLETAIKWLHSGDAPPSSLWKNEDMLIMNHRLETLLSVTHEDAQRPALMPGSGVVVDLDFSAPGWRSLDEHSGWKPCPIGVHREALL
ncbi:Las1-like-domain-containing protein [Desarmillaria tabescens]|uniref:Las1-like-domain-containing protein n=1 Tax=Armillaria tabescens TaxID=1929756 RepID=A0AA39T533_ARMTA|nr:Las1-like-domain-containing protein [Desarmillaria tabescens]KAK0465236.1 Las1-like-domain-containing protein [Desarmillaria tabescens]